MIHKDYFNQIDYCLIFYSDKKSKGYASARKFFGAGAAKKKPSKGKLIEVRATKFFQNLFHSEAHIIILKIRARKKIL